MMKQLSFKQAHKFELVALEHIQFQWQYPSPASSTIAFQKRLWNMNIISFL